MKGKEYALYGIRVQRTAEGFKLDNAELMRTDFMLPIFKERIRLRFEARLPAGSMRDEVVQAALADTGSAHAGAPLVFLAGLGSSPKPQFRQVLGRTETVAGHRSLIRARKHLAPVEKRSILNGRAAKVLHPPYPRTTPNLSRYEPKKAILSPNPYQT